MAAIWITFGFLLAGHLIACWLMFCLFTARDERTPHLRAWSVSALLLLVQVGAAMFLTPFLQEGTLIFLWFLFVLLANQLVEIPLINGIFATYSLFSLFLLLGLTVNTSILTDPDALAWTEEEQILQSGLLSERENPPPSPRAPGWVTLITENLLSTRLVDAAGVMRQILWNESPEPEPIPGPKEISTPAPAPSPTAVPTPLPTSTPVPQPTATPVPTPTAPTLPLPTPEPGAPTPTPVPPPTPIPTRAPVDFPDTDNTLRDEDAEELVQSQNRSTDPRFPAPAYNIEAVGIGAKGKYAIVDGRFVTEGAIVRTSGGEVRGWKLIRIEKKQLFWQPLL